MDPFLGSLLGSVLIGGLGSLFGANKSKQTTSTNTDPFYALMSPYALGSVLQRFQALNGAGFPSGTFPAGSFLGSMSGDIWKQIENAWPTILKGLNTKSGVSSGSLRAPSSGGTGISSGSLRQR